MPQFAYKAKAGPQNVVSGFIEAANISEAVTKLTNLGQMPVELLPYDKALPAASSVRAARVKVGPQALYQFTRQLGDLLEAGIPLVRCMELMSKQRRFPIMTLIIQSMVVSLQEGGSLSSSLAKYPDIFLPMYVHTVKAAEASGQLPLVLNRLAQFLESDMQMQSKVKSSLLYPAIIFLVGLLTIFVLLSFVLPRISSIFDDFDTQLPLLTRMVVGVSQFFSQFWWLMALGLAGGAYGLRSYLKTEKGRQAIDRQVLRVPLLKTFIENTQLSRFARTLGMLLESGVPIVTALESVVLVVDNRVLQQEVKKMAFEVRSGMSLTQAMKSASFFPDMAADLISIGQESGKLEKGLYKLAENCEHAGQEMAEVFLTILGPAVLVMVVGVVGFMIISMLLPMFQMNMLIK